MAVPSNQHFFIDPSRCIGCQSCVQACSECDTHKGTPMIHLEYVERSISTQTTPVICMHCESPTCAQVCPADAIKKTEDGVVQSARKPRCIACQNCELSCGIAESVLARSGLTDLRELSAGLLSHGQKRQLEIAMCLATRPQVLLLDEPLAGMGAEETERMLAMLAELKNEHAILLVEHDMDAVFRIADRVTVMVNGSVIACDSPEAIRSNPLVQMAYLGDHA